MTAWQQRFDARIMRSIGMPLAKLERGDGVRVWDDAGNEYLDFLAGIAVNALGHAHPVFVDAVSSQAAALAHVSNYFTTEPALELAERLTRLAGAGEHGRAWFGNSGAEANEAAFKLARLNNSGGARTRVLALVDAFHGRTMGSLALTGKPHMRDPFEPMPGGVEHIPATVEALEASLDDAVAALIVEPIQGEAGVVELPGGFLEAARELTRRHGALLIIDEIQTGAGRTGAWFGFQHAGITPDAITVAKGIGGGFPIGALVTFGETSSLFTKGQHGSTFGGNPLATAVANAVLGEIERAGLVDNAARRGDELRRRILGIGSSLVHGVRGKGLLIGVGLSEPVAGRVVAEAMRRGLIVNAANDSTIRLAPPLIIGDAEVDEFTTRFAGVLDTVASL
ncbi:acetylornithine transaminase [Agromyces humatus]|uniref:Acetylornithine transaminase n=1 Tax=Agromyces humatus TaxID=279573 RepID=A0ABN2K2J6_9MICO|nr:acetylornithine transaminase [Agromyces humatus]